MGTGAALATSLQPLEHHRSHAPRGRIVPILFAGVAVDAASTLWLGREGGSALWCIASGSIRVVRRCSTLPTNRCDSKGVSTAVCQCGGRMPHEQGPTHAYMKSAPACWRLYGELTVRLREHDGVEALQFSHVDCFAAQHVEGADVDPRQRRSVAVHLIALGMRLEHGLLGLALSRARQRTSAVILPAFNLNDWPLLEPPASFGRLTVVDLHGAAAHQLPVFAEAWPAQTWLAWHQHHALVSSWARHLHQVMS